MDSSYYHPPVALLHGPYKGAIESPEFIKSEGACSFIVGKDKAGKIVVGDLSNLLNLLVIGAGGCGKTSFVDNMIMSFVFKHSPEELRLLLMCLSQTSLEYTRRFHIYTVPLSQNPVKLRA